MVCPKDGEIIAAHQHQLFMIRHPNLLLMSGKEYFLNRYEQLGWKYSEIKPKQTIRINNINANEKNLVARLKSRGAELEKISFLPNGYWIDAKFSMGITSEYLLGLFSIQEAAAQIPAMLFTDLRSKLVLDACAAPGGKTVQLADLMCNTGAVIALDNKKKRLTALSNHLERCRVKNTIAYLIDARQASSLNVKFDRILLDMPCSGNFAADRLWFNRRKMEDIERNTKLQKEILTEATKILKDDGEIVYSTCSLEPEENELNIDWAIRNLNLQVETIDCYGNEALTNVFGKQLDKSISKCRRIWPDQTQGFFVSKLKRV